MPRKSGIVDPVVAGCFLNQEMSRQLIYIIQKKMNFKAIIIANIAEAFEESIALIQSSSKRDERISIEHGLCDRTLLWEDDDKVVITPFPISEALLQTNTDALSAKNILNIFPKQSGVSLCESIMEDNALMENVFSIIRSNPGIEISPYCVTEKFLLLTCLLKRSGLEFSVSTLSKSENPARLTAYLDSKSGSRTEINKIQNLPAIVPESFVCNTLKDAKKAAIGFFERGISCVVKADKGESGWGLIFVKKEKFLSADGVKQYLSNEFGKDGIWQKNMVLVEEYVESDTDKAVSPSVELFIGKDRPKITYICDQVLGGKGDFRGIALGKDIFQEDDRGRLEEASIVIGKRFFEIGYQGFFDIDFIISRSGVPVVIETNMRRTGGTHVYDVARKLFGESWYQKASFLSSDGFQYGKRKLEDSEVLGRMRNILYPIKNKKRGLIVSIIDRNRPVFGFILVGSSKEDVANLYSKMLSYWYP